MGFSGMILSSSMLAGIARASATLPSRVGDEVLDVAIEALDYAKDNAPWADRTGNAREGLDVDVYEEGDTIVWEMFHSVDYGLYLETRWNGRFAIIMPTLELFAPKIGRGLTERKE